MKEFDFNEWAELARTDPETFELRRKEAIAEIIDSAPEGGKDTLIRMQWIVDRERASAKDPMSACVKISSMMMNRVLGKDGLVDVLSDFSSNCRTVANLLGK
ncbi:MAG: DUF3135 domain-containing protein [Candidatus Moranbacteria bacterium]|nr:DUF3135 domain-containing protein [bacterium]MDP1833635.1 DUF3135 domain-containing protein [Candidatus Moranbacteria bacterium]MDZ4385321.1 DUF3135 domain-containing protein [Candidatus Moranbacteria bacterium]